MDCTAPVTKQLGDLLQEQQEPFALDVYLTDKGYSRNMLTSKKSTSILVKRSSRSEVMYMRMYIVASCSSAVKALIQKLGSVIVKRGTCRQKTAETTCSSDRREDRYESCSASNMKDDYVLQNEKQNHANLLCEEEVDADTKIKKIIEDGTQFSPVSVPEVTVSHEDSPIHNRQILKTMQKDVSSDSIYSDICNSLPGVREPDSNSHCTRIKSSLQQTNQLLLNCVKEIADTQRLNNRRQYQFKEPMGAVEIGEIWCKNSLSRSIQPVHVIYSKQELDTILLNSADKWSDYEEQRRGIGIEIANNIFEDISTDIVLNMYKCNYKLL